MTHRPTSFAFMRRAEPGIAASKGPRLGTWLRALFACLIACGLALAWTTLRVIRAPRERWIPDRTQWLLFIWARRGEAAPSPRSFRQWASIWLAIATILFVLGVALIVSA